MSKDDSLRLDFVVDENCLAAMHRSWRELSSEPWAYGLALFDAPVSLEIRSVILLESVYAPLGSVASLGLQRLETLPQTRSADLELFGTSYRLVFQLDDKIVTVTQGADRRSASVPYQELVTAWRVFAEKVRRFISTEFPEVLQRDDHIGVWFRGQ